MKALLIHSIRVTIASVIAALVGLHLNAGHMYWLMFTVVLVLQSEIGSSIKRSVERIGGTLIGAPIGIIIVLLIGSLGSQGALLSGIALALILAVIVLMMKKNYAVAVVFITIAVLLGYNLLGDPDITMTAGQRIFDTALGTAIAVIASIIIFPNSLNKIVQDEWTLFLKKSGDMYEMLTDEFAKQRQIKDYMAQRGDYRRLTEVLIKHANESSWELGILGANSIQKELRMTMVKAPMILSNRYLEMSTLPCVQMQINQNIEASLSLIAKNIKSFFYELAETHETKQATLNTDIEALRKTLEDEIGKIASELKKTTPDKDAFWNELVKIATFYEQSLGVLEVLMTICDTMKKHKQ